MKIPICTTCNRETESSGITLVKPSTEKSPPRYITSEYTCGGCGATFDTPQHIIENAKRQPSTSSPKPKQRVHYCDALLMVQKVMEHNFRKRNPGLLIPDELKPERYLTEADLHFIIRKLTRP